MKLAKWVKKLDSRDILKHAYNVGYRKQQLVIFNQEDVAYTKDDQ